LGTTALIPDEVDDVMVVRDLDLASVHVGDKLLDGAGSNPEFALRIDPNFRITAFVKMSTTKLMGDFV
jgi:hypothetical protein